MAEHDADEVVGHSLWAHLPATAPTVVRLSTSGTAVPEGAALALAAEVVTLGPQGPATGDVAFLVDGDQVGVAALDGSGQAVLDGLRLPAGLHAVVASYRGDPTHAAATSTALPQAVTVSAVPVVVLVTAPAPGPAGVVCEAEVVEPRSGRRADTATGEVRFRAGGRLLGTVPLTEGAAALTLPAFPAGVVTAEYGGDAEHAPATGRAAVEEAS